MDQSGYPVGPIEVASLFASKSLCSTYKQQHLTSSSTSCMDALQDGDAVIIFNFRADRVLEISRAFEYEKFDNFDRKRHPKACCMPCHVRVAKPLAWLCG